MNSKDDAKLSMKTVFTTNNRLCRLVIFNQKREYHSFTEVLNYR